MIRNHMYRILSNLILLALTFSMVGVSSAYAATLTVTNTADSGAGSLRAAIASAGIGDTITFDVSLSGTTIHLASTLTLSKNVTIDSSALSSKITLSGDTNNNGTGDVQVLHVNSDVTATLNNLVITKGTYYYGGGIDNAGTLTITNSTLSGNSATSGGGGGIYNYYGTLTVTNSTLSGNSAPSGGGGGIRNFGGTLTVTNSTLSDNSATGSGGGGISTSVGTLTVTNSMLSGNSAGSGGGIYSYGTLTVANSTLSGNSVAMMGGGIYNAGGTLTVVNSTLSDNSAYSGGGIYNADTLNYANTIIANSSSGGDCVNSATTGIGTNTHNLVEDGSCSAALSGDPNLGALASNGGPTQTMALLDGSSAIDMGDNTVCAAAPVDNLDQRGEPRPVDGDGDTNAICDIGAYESPVPPPGTTKTITTFGFTSPAATGVITGTNIAVTVPSGTDVTTLVATFTTTGESVKVGDTSQVSGITANDFTSPVTYTVIAADASTKNYIVTVCTPTITVTSIADSGAGTLRQATADVCAGGTINFNTSLSGGTIYLASTLILSRNVTIDGSALASPITLSGDTDNNGTGDVQVLTVHRSVTATIDSLIITKGATIGYQSGGGIYNYYGTLTVTNSTLSGNSATGNGGGIYNEYGTLTVTNSAFSGNSATGNGGGIYSEYGTLTVANSTLSGNSADYDGGGIYNYSTLATVTNSTFSGNSATTNNGAGGGVGNIGTLTATNSTFSGNSAIRGGGIYNTGTLTATNSTLSGNSASSDNGGGIHNEGYGTLNYANTVIANSSSGGDCANFASIGTNSHNLVEDGSCAASVSGDPNLDVLASNGGPTQTFALLVDSPAIDMGDNTICAAAPVNNTSQNSVTRPQGAACDIGSYELDPAAAKDITAFSFASPAAMGVITGTNIAVAVPFGTNVTALVATFTTTGASVAVGASPQVSGTTANNFTSPVTYTVTAADASTKDYIVTVTVAPPSANKDITTFSFISPAVTGVITGTDIAVTVPFGTDVTALVATFATTGPSVAVGATTQVSGTTANNFTNLVTYRVTAEDASTKDYIVTVTVAANPAKDITAFSFTNPAVVGVITGTNITVTVPFGTNVTALVATFTTTGASVAVGTTSQVSGTTANNFTNPITYRVTAADASTKDYVVTVTVAANPAKDITAFSFTNPTTVGVITGTNIAVTVSFGTNVTALVATFTTTGSSVAVGATSQVSGITANNFTSPVTYRVTAADASTKDYVVTVTVAANPAKDITAFSFTSPAAVGMITGTNITVNVPFETDVTALVATFTITGASVKVGTTPQVSGTTANNFTSPITYRVTAEDATTKDYVVTVTVASVTVYKLFLPLLLR